MLLPLDTIAVLLYLSLLVDSTPIETLSVERAGLMIVLLAGLTFLLGILTRSVALYIFKHLRPYGHDEARIQKLLEYATRAFVFTAFWTMTEYVGWPFTAAKALGYPNSVAVQQMAGLLPFLLFSVLMWIPLYPLHLRVHAGQWSLGSYLLHLFRYRFFILGIWIPMMLLVDELSLPAELLWRLPPEALSLGGIGILLGGAWVFPFFLRFFWGCTRLRDEALLERIQHLSNTAGVRFSGVFVWNLGGGALLNAAAVGFLPPFRYLFLSRALLKHLSEEEVEGVICHEMGHIRHHHLLYYLVITISVMSLVLPWVEMLPLGRNGILLAILIVLLGYVRLIFGFLSRRLERQADLFALECMGAATPLCEALEHIASLSGNTRAHPSWHHLSVAQRVSFLQAAEKNPALVEAHHRQVRALQHIAIVLAVAFLLTTLSDKETTPPQEHGKQEGSASTRAHILRLRYLIPDLQDKTEFDKPSAPQAPSLTTQCPQAAFHT